MKFGDKATEDVANWVDSKASRRACPVRMQPIARRKLALLNAAGDLDDLRTPGNHLEALRGDRDGQYSIRINDQYRICFRWTLDGAVDVRIIDYH
jgi:proteic killer suppression protein